MSLEPIMIDTYSIETSGRRPEVVKTAVPAWRFSGPTHPNVPPIDPTYRLRTDVVQHLVWAAFPHDNGPSIVSLLVGPPGCGKTTAVEQLAAHCNMPVYQLSLNVGVTVPHLKGRRGVHDGATTFIPGPVTQAMETGGWLILDELAGATPPVALSLLPVLAPRGAVLLEEAEPPRYAARHPLFRVFCTDNTIGAAQEENRFAFAGTASEMNPALLDRIGATVQVDYAPPEFEHQVLNAKVKLPNPVASAMIKVAQSVRTGRVNGGVFSTRMLVDWARRVAAGQATVVEMGVRRATVSYSLSAVVTAAEVAFLNRFPSEADRVAVREMIRRLFAETQTP